MNASPPNSELDALFEDIFVSPELYLQSFDVARNTMTFTPMTAETYRSTSFLDHRIHRARPVDASVNLRGFMQTFRQVRPVPRPLGLVFHTAFCCSTLLARCIEETGRTLVLKEPVPLRTLSLGWFDPAHATAIRDMKDVLAVLLPRRFGGEDVVVKTTSFCNNIMPELLGMHEDNRGVFIFSALEESIASFMKSPPSRKEARTFLAAMQNLLPENLSLEDCQSLIDAQAAALLWVLQVGLYCELASTKFAGRLMALNCNQLLADPATALASVASHLGMDTSKHVINSAVSGSAFTLHAKARDRAFGREDRRADLHRLAGLYGKEIRFASEWVRRLPMWGRIPNTLPSELVVDAAVGNVL